jgi:hypothetical protein
MPCDRFWAQLSRRFDEMRLPLRCSEMELIAFADQQSTVSRAAESVRPFQDCVENLAQITRR